MLRVDNVCDPDIHFILNGIFYGFKVIDIDTDIIPYSCKNYSSCLVEGNFEKLKKLLRSEVDEQKLSIVDEKPFCVHSMGVIGKKGTAKIRPITDCSKPEGKSVNCYMETVQDKFHYVTVENIVSHMIEGKLWVMSTVDLASAYRSVMIRPVDRCYFGLAFEGQYLVDNCLCFGSRCSPFIFNRLTDSICRFLRGKGLSCWNYLDDIICLSKDITSGIEDQLFLIQTLRRLGFYIAWNKVRSPTRKCVYLGIEIDTVEMCLRLPADRLDKLRTELLFWSKRRKATEKQLQILAGHLSHCAKIIQGANLYMHFLYGILEEARTKRKVKLTSEFHDVLQWWMNLAFSFNSVPIVDIKRNRSWISVTSGTLPVITEGALFSTEIQWPCVYLSGQEIDVCGIPEVADDYCIGYKEGERQGLMDIAMPESLIYNPVAREIIMVWAYLFNDSKLTNCTIDVYLQRKHTWLCFKKSRVKDNLLTMVLRHVFWWAMERNVKLSFYYSPIG